METRKLSCTLTSEEILTRAADLTNKIHERDLVAAQNKAAEGQE